MWRALQIVWLVWPLGRGWHAQTPQNDVSCPVRSIIPARGAGEMWLSSLSSTRLVDVFIFLLWSKRTKCMVGPMTRDTAKNDCNPALQASALCDVVRTHLAHPHGIGMNPSITISSMARWRPVIKQPPERTAMLPTAERPTTSSRPLSLSGGDGKGSCERVPMPCAVRCVGYQPRQPRQTHREIAEDSLYIWSLICATLCRVLHKKVGWPNGLLVGDLQGRRLNTLCSKYCVSVVLFCVAVRPLFSYPEQMGPFSDRAQNTCSVAAREAK